MLEKKYTHRRVAILLVFLVVLIGVFYADKLYLWIFTTLMLALSLVFVYFDRSPQATRNEDLIDHVINSYKSIAYPPNYYGMDEETALTKVRSRLRPIHKEIGTTITAKLPGLLVLVLIIVTFGVSLLAIYVHVFDNSELEIFQLLLLSIDSAAKGALMDFLESFRIDIYDHEINEYYVMVIDFTIRTCVSLIVVKYALDAIKEARVRRMYNKTMNSLEGKVDFFFRLSWVMRSWSAGIPDEHSKYLDSRYVIDEIIIPFLWENDGMYIDEEFDSIYKRFSHRSMGHDNIEFKLLTADLNFQALKADLKRDLATDI